MELPARLPYDGEGVLRWLAARLVPGVEELTATAYRRTLRLGHWPGVVVLEPRDDRVRATLHVRAAGDAPRALARCRALFDLDAQPSAHNPVLAADPALAPLVAA